MSEGDYTDELGKVVSEESLANEFTKVSYKIGSGGVEVPTMEEFNGVVEGLEDICNQQMRRNFKVGYVYTGVDTLYFSDNDVRAYESFIVKAGNYIQLNDVYGYFCYYHNSKGDFHVTEEINNVYTTSMYIEEDTEFYISERTGINNKFGVYYGKYEHINSTNLVPNEHIIEVGKGKQFTRILDAGLYSKNHPNTNLKIVVYGGEYNLINEFKDVYGENFFDDMQEGEYGIPIGFGEKWLFAPNANVYCIYGGDNNNVHNSFCCFYTAQGGGFYDFEIVGLHVLVENIKYCVHDENMSSNIPYHHKYTSCNMIIRQNGSLSWSETWWSTKCIGGGLGECGNIEIDGCIFDSRSENDDKVCVSYHNAYNEKSVSTLIIKNSYIAGDKTVRFGYYGKSTDFSTFIVSNNSLGSTPIKVAEVPDSVDNCSMIVFGNEIRNN